MSERFHDTATAYQLHRAVTDEAQAISTAVCEYAAAELRLTRHRLRVVDAGTGDGQVLKSIAEELLQYHRARPCEMLLKEYDFHHIEMLLQNIAPLLRRSPRLTLFVTNRAFRQLKHFADDLCVENTVCFDDMAGYRLLTMVGTARHLGQDEVLRAPFPPAARDDHRASRETPFSPLNDLRNDERLLFLADSRPAVKDPALAALGDEIRAREIYAELAAAGRGKHFTVTITRRDGDFAACGNGGEFFSDLTIVSHAFNRDKDPGWVCRNILLPLCDGLAIGGVLVNVHAVENGQLAELKGAVFGDRFPFNTGPDALAQTLRSGLDPEQYELLSSRRVSYRSHIKAALFHSLEAWQQDLTLERLATSVAYHLQIPGEAWMPLMEPIQAKIRHLLDRDGQLEYELNLVGAKRRGVQ